MQERGNGKHQASALSLRFGMAVQPERYPVIIPRGAIG